MKFLGAKDNKLSFQIEAWEKRLLFELLNLYPAVPAGHHKLTRANDHPEDQQLLDETLAAQRKENRERVAALLKNASRFHEVEDGFNFEFDVGQVEWLLQVLNDVRVGSWIKLGSPEGPRELFAAVNDKTAAQFWAIEAVGHFQMALLGALNGEK